MSTVALRHVTLYDRVLHEIAVLAVSNQHATNSRTPTQIDTALVAAALDGDGDAFGRIVQLHQAAMAAQMRRFSRDQLVIEELVHDVFVEAYTGLKNYRADAPLLHWLRRIAVRVGYRFWKQQSRLTAKTVSLSDVGERVRQFATHGESAASAGETLGGLLEQLAPADRLVLTLIYWDGCSTAEAAELAGWSQTNVKVRAHRARKRLRNLIEESLQ